MKFHKGEDLEIWRKVLKEKTEYSIKYRDKGIKFFRINSIYTKYNN